MPRISEFFGIVVYMYWFDNQRHKMPHFHARYGSSEAVFTLDGTRIEGNLGRRAESLIRDWAQERRSELAECWAKAAAGKELPWITPLR